MNPKSIYAMSGSAFGLALLAWIEPLQCPELLLTSGLLFVLGVAIEEWNR